MAERKYFAGTQETWKRRNIVVAASSFRTSTLQLILVGNPRTTIHKEYYHRDREFAGDIRRG